MLAPNSASCPSKNSISKGPKMEPTKCSKITQITLILRETESRLNLQVIQTCSDLLRMRRLVKKCNKITLYLADMLFSFASKICYQYTFIRYRIEKLHFLILCQPQLFSLIPSSSQISEKLKRVAIFGHLSH